MLMKPTILVSSQQNCDECEGPLTISEGYLVCKKCGLVHSPVYDQKQYSYDEYYQKRILFNSNQNTTIFPKNRRLANNDWKYNGSLNKFDINSWKLERLCSLLQLPNDVVLQIASKYFSYRDNPEYRSYQTTSLMLVAVISVCRGNRLPILLDTIYNTGKNLGFKVTKRQISRLLAQFNINTRLYPEDYVGPLEDQLFSEYNIPTEKREHHKIASLLSLYQKYFVGTNPMIFSIVVLYIVYRKHGLTQRDMSRLYGVADNSISRIYRILMTKLE